MTNLSELRARVEAASGPDAGLDIEILAWECEHLRGWVWKKTGPDYDGLNDNSILTPPNLSNGYTYPNRGAIRPHWHVPREKITASLDAALALVERLKPELMKFVGDLDPTDMRAVATLSHGYPDQPTYRGFAPQGQYALAMVAALLSALEHSK